MTKKCGENNLQNVFYGDKSKIIPHFEKQHPGLK